MNDQDPDITLRELAVLGRDGKEFYEYAQLMVDGPLHARFASAARAKAELLALLASRVSPLRAPAPPGAASDASRSATRPMPFAFRQALSHSRRALQRGRPADAVAALDTVERHVLTHYRARLAGATDPRTRDTLALLVPVLAEGGQALGAGPAVASAGLVHGVAH